MKAIHFARNDMRLGYGDGRHIKTGRTLKVNPDKLEPCVYGLHASVRPIDALYLASGHMICLVELSGRIIPQGNPIDKYCASERTCLSYFDGERLLRKFACRQALVDIEKIKPYVRDYDVIVKYLTTQDESLREAAWIAAHEAALKTREIKTAIGEAAWVAWVATWKVTRAAACAAARSAARREAILTPPEAGIKLAADETVNKMLSDMIVEKTGWDMSVLGHQKKK